jgi:hypothetical protein
LFTPDWVDGAEADKWQCQPKLDLAHFPLRHEALV